MNDTLEQPQFGLGKAQEEVEKKEQQEVFLDGIMFKRFERKGKGKAGQFDYRSSSPDRKIIILEPSSPKPQLDKPYRVKIIKDTDPGDPMNGKFLAEIVPFSVEEGRQIKQLAQRAKDLFEENNLDECRQILQALYVIVASKT